MPTRRATTGATVLESSRVETCHCDRTRNVAEDTKHCLFPCENTITKDWTMCRPCALGNHSGKPCPQFIPDYPANLMKTCRGCGYEAPGHERGSDGRPYGEV